MAPIDPGKQIAELRRRDRYRPIGRAWPQEAAFLQTLGEQARALAIMPDDLQQIAFAPAKAKQMAAQTDPGAAPPGPATTAKESRAACRCGRSPATPARQWEPGSSPLPPACRFAVRDRPVQKINDTLQGIRVDAGAHPHKPAIPQLDLDAIVRPAASSASGHTAGRGDRAPARLPALSAPHTPAAEPG